jgi:hypothetical protein
VHLTGALTRSVARSNDNERFALSRISGEMTGSDLACGLRLILCISNYYATSTMSNTLTQRCALCENLLFRMSSGTASLRGSRTAAGSFSASLAAQIEPPGPEAGGIGHQFAAAQAVRARVAGTTPNGFRRILQNGR